MTTETGSEPAAAADARDSPALTELPNRPDDVREAVLAFRASQTALVHDDHRPADLNAHQLLPLTPKQLMVEAVRTEHLLNAIGVLVPMLEVPVYTPRLYVLLVGRGAPWPTCGAVWLVRQYALAIRVLVKSDAVRSRADCAKTPDADASAFQCHEQVIREHQRECKQLQQRLLARLAELGATALDGVVGNADDRYRALFAELRASALAYVRTYERAIMRLCHEACTTPSIPEHYREGLHAQQQQDDDELPPVTPELAQLLATQRRWVIDVRRRFFTYREDADDGSVAMDSLALAPPPPGMPTRAEMRSFARFLSYHATTSAVADVQLSALAMFLQKDAKAAADAVRGTRS